MDRGRARSPIDGLTPKERDIVQARLAKPRATLLEIAKAVGMKGDKTQLQASITRTLRRPRCVAALVLAQSPPPPEQAVDRKKLSQMTDAERRVWLLDFYQTVADNKIVPTAERIRAANTVAEMTAGAKVPVGINHSGVFNLEQFVAAAGGKPADAPGRTPEGEMPN